MVSTNKTALLVAGLLALVVMVLSAYVASRVDKHDSSKDLEDYRKMSITNAVLAAVTMLLVVWVGMSKGGSSLY